MTVCERLPIVTTFLYCMRLRTGLLVLSIFTNITTGVLAYSTIFFKTFFFPVKNSVNFESWFLVILILWFITTTPLNAAWSGAVQGEQMDTLLKIQMGLVLILLAHQFSFCLMFLVACLSECMSAAFVQFGFFAAVLLVMSYSLLIVNSYRILGE